MKKLSKLLSKKFNELHLLMEQTESKDTLKVIADGLEDLQDLYNAEEFFNERDFVAPDGSLFRPDRLVKIQDKWVLMDYKTGEPKKKYENQLNNYAKFLTDLGMPVSKKLLIFLDQEEGVVEIEQRIIKIPKLILNLKFKEPRVFLNFEELQKILNETLG